MTIAITLKVNDGVVVASDSATTMNFGSEAERPFVRSLPQLAAVDGAVLLDSRLGLHGFGAFFVEQPAAPIPIIRWGPDGIPEPINPAEHFGGRHRSAAELCKRNTPAAAIVLSEDGRSSLFVSAPGAEAVLWTEFVTLHGPT